MRFQTGLLSRGYLLNQRYSIISPLGQGGMGAVYKAKDIQLGNRTVAVKEMSLGDLNSEKVAEATDAFKREAYMLAGLMHTNLPRIYDLFTEDGRWYLVMDFIEGHTLEEYVNKAGGGPPPVKEVLDIGIQLCTVLQYLHSHQPVIIFRDLKPTNIMRTPEGHLYLIDFGIARHFKPGQNRDTLAFGSRGYAAPEQHGQAQTTPQSDIYSLGVMLHQLLSGNDPSSNMPTLFHFPPLQSHNQPIPTELKTLIEQMLEVDANKRPANIAVVEEKLQRIAAQLTVAQMGNVQRENLANSPALPKPGLSRRTVLVSLGLAGLSAAIVGGGAVFWLREAKTTPRPPASSPSLSQFPYIYRGHTGEVDTAAWSPNGKYIASGSRDNTVQVWSLFTGEYVGGHPYTGHISWVFAVAWSPDGRRIASASADDTVQVWDASTEGGILIYKGHTAALLAVAWSPDGKWIASGGVDKTVQVWNASSGDPVLTYFGHSAEVDALAWSPDSRRIVSAGKDQKVQVWSAVTGSRILTYTGHAAEVDAVAWSPNGTRIASGGLDNLVRVWDVTTGGNSFTFTYSGHTDRVRGVAWSPDGKYIASASADHTVQVVKVGDILQSHAFTYRGHSNWVHAVAWSPDGRYIASASADHTVQVWQVV